MKFHLSVIALLGLTLALALPTFATAGETIDCSTTPGTCQALPDLCNCTGVAALGVSGDGSSGNPFAATGGRPPFEVGIDGGVTLDYSDSGVTVSSFPACTETATLTMKDACEQTATKELQFPATPVTVTGPTITNVNEGARFSVSGGVGPYTWGATGVTIAEVVESGVVNTWEVTDLPACTSGAARTAVITVTDDCGNQDTLDITLFGGGWKVISDQSTSGCKYDTDSWFGAYGNPLQVNGNGSCEHSTFAYVGTTNINNTTDTKISESYKSYWKNPNYPLNDVKCSTLGQVQSTYQRMHESFTWTQAIIPASCDSGGTKHFLSVAYRTVYKWRCP